jgi:integrase/recombinase XerC
VIEDAKDPLGPALGQRVIQRRGDIHEHGSGRENAGAHDEERATSAHRGNDEYRTGNRGGQGTDAVADAVGNLLAQRLAALRERDQEAHTPIVASPVLDFLPHRANLCGQEAAVPHLSPTTLTVDEQRAVLRVTQANLRDHLIVSLALGTALRLAEIVGLDVGDVYAPDGTPRARVRVRAGIAKGGRAADVFLPDRLIAKLVRFWRWKRERGEDVSPAAPLFANQSGRRISKRRVQFAWATWQRRAGFDRVYGFHALRHTAVTNVYRASRDLFLAQRFARHLSPLTTTVYTHPSDQEMAGRVRGLVC